MSSWRHVWFSFYDSRHHVYELRVDHQNAMNKHVSLVAKYSIGVSQIIQFYSSDKGVETHHTNIRRRGPTVGRGRIYSECWQDSWGAPRLATQPKHFEEKLKGVRTQAIHQREGTLAKNTYQRGQVKIESTGTLLESQILSGIYPKEKRKEGHHDLPIPKDASQVLLPIFECLTKADLLERCMSLGTSNTNESLHTVIWRRANKAAFSSRKH